MTKLKIKREVTDEIEVDLPFYWNHDLSEYNTQIYGRVDETGSIEIHWHERAGTIEVTIERNTTGPNNFTCYLKPIHRSNKQEFDEMFAKAMTYFTTTMLEAGLE